MNNCENDARFTRLNGMNYVDWAFWMEFLLMEKEVWDIVGGTETCPPNTPNHKAMEAFLKKQCLAHCQCSFPLGSELRSYCLRSGGIV